MTTTRATTSAETIYPTLPLGTDSLVLGKSLPPDDVRSTKPQPAPSTVNVMDTKTTFPDGMVKIGDSTDVLLPLTTTSAPPFTLPVVTDAVVIQHESVDVKGNETVSIPHSRRLNLTESSDSEADTGLDGMSSNETVAGVLPNVTSERVPPLDTSSPGSTALPDSQSVRSFTDIPSNVTESEMISQTFSPDLSGVFETSPTKMLSEIPANVTLTTEEYISSTVTPKPVEIATTSQTIPYYERTKAWERKEWEEKRGTTEEPELGVTAAETGQTKDDDENVTRQVDEFTQESKHGEMTTLAHSSEATGPVEDAMVAHSTRALPELFGKVTTRTTPSLVSETFEDITSGSTTDPSDLGSTTTLEMTTPGGLVESVSGESTGSRQGTDFTLSDTTTTGRPSEHGFEATTEGPTSDSIDGIEATTEGPTSDSIDGIEATTEGPTSDSIDGIEATTEGLTSDSTKQVSDSFSGATPSNLTAGSSASTTRSPDLKPGFTSGDKEFLTGINATTDGTLETDSSATTFTGFDAVTESQLSTGDSTSGSGSVGADMESMLTWLYDTLSTTMGDEEAVKSTGTAHLTSTESMRHISTTLHVTATTLDAEATTSDRDRIASGDFRPTSVSSDEWGKIARSDILPTTTASGDTDKTSRGDITQKTTSGDFSLTTSGYSIPPDDADETASGDVLSTTTASVDFDSTTRGYSRSTTMPSDDVDKTTMDDVISTIAASVEINSTLGSETRLNTTESEHVVETSSRYTSTPPTSSEALPEMSSVSATDPCDQYNPCRNGATCYLDATTRELACICPQGFSGKLCADLEPSTSSEGLDKVTSSAIPAHAATSIDPTAPPTSATTITRVVCTRYNPCLNGATCTIDTTTGRIGCECPEGFSGVLCQTPQPCQPNPCENGGTCTLQKGEIRCSCPQGVSGTLCQDVEGPDIRKTESAMEMSTKSVTVTTNTMEVTTSGDAKEATSGDIATVKTTSTDLRQTASADLRPSTTSSTGADKAASVLTAQTSTPSGMGMTSKDLIQSTVTSDESDTTGSAVASTEDVVTAESHSLPEDSTSGSLLSSTAGGPASAPTSVPAVGTEAAFTGPSFIVDETRLSPTTSDYHDHTDVIQRTTDSAEEETTRGPSVTQARPPRISNIMVSLSRSAETSTYFSRMFYTTLTRPPVTPATLRLATVKPGEDSMTTSSELDTSTERIPPGLVSGKPPSPDTPESTREPAATVSRSIQRTLFIESDQTTVSSAVDSSQGVDTPVMSSKPSRTSTSMLLPEKSLPTKMTATVEADTSFMTSTPPMTTPVWFHTTKKKGLQVEVIYPPGPRPDLSTAKPEKVTLTVYKAVQNVYNISRETIRETLQQARGVRDTFVCLD